MVAEFAILIKGATVVAEFAIRISGTTLVADWAVLPHATIVVADWGVLPQATIVVADWGVLSRRGSAVTARVSPAADDRVAMLLPPGYRDDHAREGGRPKEAPVPDGPTSLKISVTSVVKAFSRLVPHGQPALPHPRCAGGERAAVVTSGLPTLGTLKRSSPLRTVTATSIGGPCGLGASVDLRAER